MCDEDSLQRNLVVFGYSYYICMQINIFRKQTFRASIHTAYRDRKIKENPNGFLERIETIPTDKERLIQRFLQHIT